MENHIKVRRSNWFCYLDLNWVLSPADFTISLMFPHNPSCACWVSAPLITYTTKDFVSNIQDFTLTLHQKPQISSNSDLWYSIPPREICGSPNPGLITSLKAHTITCPLPCLRNTVSCMYRCVNFFSTNFFSIQDFFLVYYYEFQHFSKLLRSATIVFCKHTFIKPGTL